MHIGVLSVQGDIQEHISMTENALEKKGIEGTAYRVKSKEEIKDIDGLILPGGESTTISRFIRKENLVEEIKNLSHRGAIMGTCAGVIVMAKECNDERVNPLPLMNIRVNRNAYGRQRESFEAPLEIKEIGKFPGVFIRAPRIEEAKKGKVMATHGEKPVMVREENLLALTFHPELTEDTRIHEYFLDLIQ